MSFQAEQQMKSTMALYPEMEIQMLEAGYGPHTWSGSCNGVLKQGVRAYCLDDSRMFITVYYEGLETLCEGEPVGRIIYYDSLEEASAQKERFEKLGYTVNAEAVKIENIQASADVQKEAFDKARMMTVLITALILLAVKAAALWKRSYEFALLRMNGITGGRLGQMLFLEDIPVLAGVFAAILPISLLLWVLKRSVLMRYIWLAWLSVLVILVTLSLLSGLYLKWLNVEKILRS